MAQGVMKTLHVQKHSFRRTLAMALVPGSVFLENSPLADLYYALISQLFGRSTQGRSMLAYYTSGKSKYSFGMLPEVTRVAKTGAHFGGRKEP